MADNSINPLGGQEAPGELQKNEISNGVRITDAVYQILDFFPDGDPLKNKAKEKALAILENLTLISDSRGWVSLKKEKAAAELLDDTEILEAYLKLGKDRGWMDNMSFLILIKGYDKIKSGINPPKGIVRQNLEIISRPAQEPAKIIKETKREPSHPMSADVGHLKKGDKKYSDRQKKILDILSKREKAQVSDLIKELPNITKRTVRRDLGDLLRGGKIIRVGEWNQVFYKTLKNSVQNQVPKFAEGGPGFRSKSDLGENTAIKKAITVQGEKITLVSITHSIDDLAQLFDYKEGTFANNYNPELANKIRSINLPEKITSVDQLESIIKYSLTLEEQLLVNKHLTDRMDELRNQV